MHLKNECHLEFTYKYAMAIIVKSLLWLCYYCWMMSTSLNHLKKMEA